MIKVEHTRTLRTFQRSGLRYETVLVTDAELVLVECNMHESLIYKHKNGSWGITKEGIYFHFEEATYYKPILISRTEKIEEGDKLEWKGEIITFDGYKKIDSIWKEAVKANRKILALPEHFSYEQLQMIVDGKLKDGDKVLVECEDLIAIDGHTVVGKEIKLNPHITIYPVVEEKMYTREEVREIVLSIVKEISYGNNDLIGHYSGDFRDAKKWFEENVKL